MISNSKKIQILTNVILILLCLLCVLPFLLLIASSLTQEKALAVNGYSFFPKSLSLDAYRYLWTSRIQILKAYGITVIVTFLGTTANIIITTLMAYPLSRRDLPGRNIVSFYIFFTMLFNGGLVPTYMMYTNMQIKDTLYALIIPMLLVNAYYVIMMRSYFTTNLPTEFIEAAKVDGASELRILMKIVVPLSKPVMGTVGLMVGITYWNDWQNGLYYLVKRTDLYSIQNLLNRMISSAEFLNNPQNQAMFKQAGEKVPSIGIRMAIAVIALLPILAIYPFFQNTFVKGITVGGVKG